MSRDVSPIARLRFEVIVDVETVGEVDQLDFWASEDGYCIVADTCDPRSLRFLE